MSGGIDIEFVREHYRNMTDGQIIHIATADAAGLTPEAQQVIGEEIERRSLDISILKAVEVQNKEHSPEDVIAYAELLRNLECPVCGDYLSKLNATVTYEVLSIVLITRYSKKLKIACPHCLDKANSRATDRSLLLGWWGLPLGPIRTLQAFVQNSQHKQTNHQDDANKYLLGFTMANIGRIETYKNDPQKLQQLILQS